MTDAFYNEAIAYAAVFNPISAWDVERIANRFPQKDRKTIRRDIAALAEKYAANA